MLGPIDFANTEVKGSYEPSWHRNQRKQRQLARGVVAATKLRVDLGATARNDAFKRLSCHHGSAIGSMAPQEKKHDWLCKSCKGADGKPFCNFGFRLVCKHCNIGKGSCFGGRTATQQPAHRTLAAKQVMAQKQADKAKLVEKKRDDAEKAKKENEKLKKEIEKLRAAQGQEQFTEAEDKELGFKAKLSELEEQKQFFTKYGMQEHLATVQVAIKDLKANQEATVPEGLQFKRAENHLAKVQKQSLASKASVATIEKELEDAKKKDEELDKKVDEAKLEVEKARKRIAVPKVSAHSFSWAEVSQGHRDSLQVLPPDLAQQHGLGPEQQQQLNDLLTSLANLQAAATKRKAEEEEAVARNLAATKESVANTATSVGDTGAAALGQCRSHGQQPPSAYAVAAKPVIVNDDVLMALCEGSNAELARAAKLIMESDVVAKRRKLASS